MENAASVPPELGTITAPGDGAQILGELHLNQEGSFRPGARNMAFACAVFCKEHVTMAKFVVGTIMEADDHGPEYRDQKGWLVRHMEIISCMC